MYRPVLVLLALAGGGRLAGNVPVADDSEVSKVTRQVRIDINERLDDACRSVALKRKADAVYGGHAEFLDGTIVDLEASVLGNAIEYRFLRRPQSSASVTEAHLAELETLVARQRAEIIRLRGLCVQAGIRADPPRLETVPVRSEDANGVHVESASESQPAVYEDRETTVEENPRFTWRVYANIRKGMSYAQVANTLRDGGDLISGSYFDNARNEVIVWTNPDDSHICVVFRNGVVLVKTQFGLPESAAEPPR